MEADGLEGQETMMRSPLPAPAGAGSRLTLFYSIGAPMVPIPLGPPFLGKCSGAAAIIGILPITGAVFDTCGFLGPKRR